MVTRNYGMPDLSPYPRLLQIGNGDSGGDDIEDHCDILTLDELRPHPVATQSVQQHEGVVYYDLSSMPE
jgi:hypothetical protein